MAIIKNTPTISTSAYSDGDVIGGAIELDGFNAGLLTVISVYDADGEGVQLDFFLFRGALTGTYTDNAAFAPDAGDIDQFIGVTSIETGDYLAAGSDKAGSKEPVNIMLPSAVVSVVMVIRSATTFTATNDLRLTFHILES